MILCVCRDINESQLSAFIAQNRHLLQDDWNTVSANLSGEDTRCHRCEEEGQNCLEKIRTNRCEILCK